MHENWISFQNGKLSRQQSPLPIQHYQMDCEKSLSYDNFKPGFRKGSNKYSKNIKITCGINYRKD